MTAACSDALVFFGATGDLAYKKIFPALQAMIRRDHVDMPVAGVAQSQALSPCWWVERTAKETDLRPTFEYGTYSICSLRFCTLREGGKE